MRLSLNLISTGGSSALAAWRCSSRVRQLQPHPLHEPDGCLEGVIAVGPNMKLSSTFLWAASLLTAKTSASDANIYVSGFPPGASRQTVSPSTTRLLLAQRLGLSRFHSLKGADETTLSILNDFGGEQKTLLSANRWSVEGQPRHLIVIEGVRNAEGEIYPSPFSMLSSADIKPQT